MNSTSVFEKVAAGELTAEQAATKMIEEDRRAADARRPAWAPSWLWSALGETMTARMCAALLLYATLVLGGLWLWGTARPSCPASACPGEVVLEDGTCHCFAAAPRDETNESPARR